MGGRTGAASSSRLGRGEELWEGGDGGRMGDGVEGEGEAEEDANEGGGGGDGGGEFGRGSWRATSTRARAAVAPASVEAVEVPRVAAAHRRFSRVPLGGGEGGAGDDVVSVVAAAMPVGGAGGGPLELSLELPLELSLELSLGLLPLEPGRLFAGLVPMLLLLSRCGTRPRSSLSLPLSLSSAASSFLARIRSSSDGRALRVGRMPSMHWDRLFGGGL